VVPVPELPLRVMMLGLRGFPDVQGGVETHAENLCPLLVKLGCAVTVLARSPYQPAAIGKVWKGVKFISIWAPKHKMFEAISHSFLSVLYAATKRPDILHIQAIGPALMTPLARLLGLKVVVTHHGPDYDRQKWHGFARFMLRLGERWGMNWAHGRIVISTVIANDVRDKFGLGSALIPNGVNPPDFPDSTDVLDQFELESGRYVLLVSRLVAEKRHPDLINAFALATLPGWKLVLVGASDHVDGYTQAVLNLAKTTRNVVCTGFQTGVSLQALYANAGFFVLPSSHEGLPIAMLEALSYGLPVVASDIPANLEVDNEGISYYPLGNVQALSVLMSTQGNSVQDNVSREKIRQSVIKHYNWSDIAQRTYDVYCAVNRG
jgi:glycosyltransferase involved in cell wall biosynthesis